MATGTKAKLGPRFEEALVYAAQVHGGQVRKGTGIPYVAHLLAVAGLVLEVGGDEDEAIAGLLHDAAEDAGGEARLADIRGRFGDRVAEIVAGCTDSYGERTSENWRERKDGYLEQLESVSDVGVLRVSIADKLHNTRTILADLRSWKGKRSVFWARFHAGKNDQLWYYGELADTYLRKDGVRPAARELRRVVRKIRAKA